jgi:hypothetical protein
MINAKALLDFYESHSDYEVKQLKNKKKYNIEYRFSNQPRKNVIAEMNSVTSNFYLRKGKDWVNVALLEGINSNDDVVKWVESDSNHLFGIAK